jgi:alkaline phosphatase D
MTAQACSLFAAPANTAATSRTEPAKAGVTRRQLLVSSGTLAAGLLITRYGRAQGAGTPFTLGVASGSPSPDGFVLWTRLAPQPLAPDGSGGMAVPVTVFWEIAADDAMRYVVQSGGAVEANRRSAHSVHLEVGGLEPNRPYWYRFTAPGEQSPVGRARTAPRPTDQIDRLRFAFASCSHWELGYFSAYRHMVAENPDLVLFLGDYIYEYTVPAEQAGRTARRHDGPTATDLAGYRNRYALYRTDPDLQALHAAAPCLMTWDDHEVENDYANEWSQNIDVSPEAYEHMPLRARAAPTAGAMRLYDRFRLGNLVTFAVLDGRQYRSSSRASCRKHAADTWRRTAALSALTKTARCWAMSRSDGCSKVCQCRRTAC